MRRQAKDLIFISKLLRDGSGTFIMSDSDRLKIEQENYLSNEWYDLQSLSISHGTYIAFSNICYIVKLKEIKKSNIGLIGELTKKQIDRGYFSTLPIGTKFIIIDEMDLPAYNATGYFINCDPQILNNGETHFIGFIEKDSWKVVGEVKDNINLLIK